MAAELAALLHFAVVPGPYVIVGHSNRGMVAQLFACARPSQIAGIVLLDSAPHAAELVRRELPPGSSRGTRRRHDSHPTTCARPLNSSTTRRAASSCERTGRPHRCRPCQWPCSSARQHPPELAEPYEPIRHQMQRDVAALVPGARYQVVAGTGHDIHQERPDVVAGTILDTVTGGTAVKPAAHRELAGYQRRQGREAYGRSPTAPVSSDSPPHPGRGDSPPSTSSGGPGGSTSARHSRTSLSGIIRGLSDTAGATSERMTFESRRATIG
jgi:hypothetical protein